ncbi:tetraspanin-2A [Planococcus citri]|uniref:tetraspanin-2A n=1 Tax=Planococcus citri TaxID=170843 RepID=UPI0031F9F00F
MSRNEKRISPLPSSVREIHQYAFLRCVAETIRKISVTMAVKTLSQIATVLESQINVLKYTLYCITVIEWILGGFLFGLAVATRLDTGLNEWIEALDIWQFYVGIYILIFTSLLIIIIPFLSCFSVYQEIKQLLLSNVACHGFCFLLLMIGCAITMENSKSHSGIQQSIRDSMQRMIVNSYDNRVSHILNLIQEEVGCCGADGPNDYLALQKPLPNECRDTVTGNAYFHGCSDEVTWFLEDKSSWLTGIGFTLGFLQMLVAALSFILLQALQKEEKMAYRR